MTGYLGKLETRNYEFITYQDSVDKVVYSLKTIWQAHAISTNAFYTWEDLEDSVTITPLRLGDTLTDCAQCENALHN